MRSASEKKYRVDRSESTIPFAPVALMLRNRGHWSSLSDGRRRHHQSASQGPRQRNGLTLAVTGLPPHRRAEPIAKVEVTRPGPTCVICRGDLRRTGRLTGPPGVRTVNYAPTAAPQISVCNFGTTASESHAAGAGRWSQWI